MPIKGYATHHRKIHRKPTREGDGVPRICDCRLHIRPAEECPSGKCLTQGRRAAAFRDAPASDARDHYRPRSDIERGLGSDNGARWVSGEHDGRGALPKGELL